MALSPIANPSLINGSKTRYSSSSSLKNAQICRVSCTTEPARDIGVTGAVMVTFQCGSSSWSVPNSIAELAEIEVSARVYTVTIGSVKQGGQARQAALPALVAFFACAFRRKCRRRQ